MARPYIPKIIRFWKFVNKDGPLHPILKTKCWIWTGSKIYGYGQLTFGRISVRVHRMSWKMHYGEIPDGLSVLHRCDQRNCVNPEHLFLGTQLGNMQDKVEKDRQVKGENHSNAKLTEEQVREIRSLYIHGSRICGSTALARKYGVAQGTIWQIIKGNNWRHVR